MEKPSSRNVPSNEWQTGLEFQVEGEDEWLKMQDERLDSDSIFVVTSTNPNQDGYADGMDIVARGKTLAIDIKFTNHSVISDKAIQI